jgi:FkbM family methyltransferase
MKKLQKLLRYSRFVAGSVVQLKNWLHLLTGTVREKYGAEIKEMPVLQFRNGLELCMAQGSFSGFYILFQEINIKRCYQPTNRFKIRDGYTVVDIGANMGFFTCQAARASKTGRVIAVEPVSAYVEKLKDNVRRNGLRNVTVLPVAVSGKPDQRISITVWYTKAGEPKTGSVYPETMSPERVEHQTVSALMLKEIFSNENVGHCDFLKIDIEGGEYDLFDGIPSDLWKKIDRIAMETHSIEGHDPMELSKALEQNGFRVMRKDTMLWASRL